MIGFLFALALHSKSRKTEGRVNLRYVQVVYTVSTFWLRQTNASLPCQNIRIHWIYVCSPGIRDCSSSFDHFQSHAVLPIPE